jgi:flavin reductase (DIM6/NTAB) family NADH-FMN oxidoreductase RutF
MKHFTITDIEALDNIRKANFINSISGYKPANLIGTISNSNQTNLAIFSSVVHLGANPPLLGFVLRPALDVPRNTYDNIKETGTFTINHVHANFAEQAHFTSAKFDKNISEFDVCNFTPEYIPDFKAPFVKESYIKIGLTFEDEIPIKQNNCIFIIGKIAHILVPENSIIENGSIDLNSVQDITITGLDTYHTVKKMATYPYARPANVPNFKGE